ncbi:MAG: glycosyltransferase [Bauldia litoralis]
MPLGETLGVLKFYAKAIASIRDAAQFIYVVDDPDGFGDSVLAEGFDDGVDKVLTSNELRSSWLPKDWIELMAHHFQDPVSEFSKVQLFFDFHAFSVPWKYGNAKRQQDKIRENYVSCAAAITPFPYTYFSFKETVGRGTGKLFLSPCPILIDDQLARRAARGEFPDTLTGTGSDRPGITLFYPAQLQAHKNHRLLWRIIRKLSETMEVRCLMTGTGFTEALSDRLLADAASLGVTSSLSHLGVVPEEELAALYRYADVTVIPSLAEGGALVALEALACGGRVACSGIQQAVTHLEMKAALPFVELFDPWSANEAVAAILRARDRAPIDEDDIVLDSVADLGETLKMVMQFVKHEIRRPQLMVDGSGKFRGYAS